MDGATLVIPGGLRACLLYAAEARARGEHVVGSSCVANDPGAGAYEDWIYLPAVHDPAFAAALARAVEEHAVTAVYCPHSIIHEGIRQALASGAAPVVMVNEAPAAAESARVREALRVGEALEPYVRSLVAPAGATPTALEISAHVNQANAIPGQSDDDKLATLLGVFASAPRGDVVEIGALWGRSAVLLVSLATRHETGTVLVVDPWSADHALQSSAPGIVQRDTGLQQWDLIHAGFLMHLLPVGRRRLNYLRTASLEAARRYAQHPRVESAEFGVTEYAGRIAVLHVDGNHDYDAVRTDVDAWSAFLGPGSWLVLDDYRWLHGDGPRRAGDEFLAAHGSRIERAFVAGGALFAQLAT